MDHTLVIVKLVTQHSKEMERKEIVLIEMNVQMELICAQWIMESVLILIQQRVVTYVHVLMDLNI